LIKVQGLEVQIVRKITHLSENVDSPCYKLTLEHIDDLEDVYLADKHMEDLRVGRSETYSLNEVGKLSSLQVR